MLRAEVIDDFGDVFPNHGRVDNIDDSVMVYICNLYKRKSEMKRTVELIDEIIKEGEISDANLRQLIDKIIIYESSDGLRIQVNLRADFTEHMIIFDTLGDQSSDLKVEGKCNYPFAMRRRMRVKK